MNKKIATFAVALVAALPAFGLDVGSKGMPQALPMDSSPVTDGRSGPVTSYADVVEPVQKAVVSIYTTKVIHEQLNINPLLRQFFGNQLPDEVEGTENGLGSGVIVRSDGYILTNNHVVEGADELYVTLPNDGGKYKAKLVGADPKTDVAVIKIDARNLPTITRADSDKLRVGDIVFAVGNPLDVGETVTMGIVSAKSRHLGLLDRVSGLEDYIQTDAAINLGNSGGALVDAKGRLIGINSAIVSPSQGNIGIGFAIPVNLAFFVMQGLMQHGTVTRGYLGVDTQPVTPELSDQLELPAGTHGVIIADVDPGSPAERAGLKPSDVVVAINGKAVAESEDLQIIISETAPNTRVSLGVMRDGKPMTIDVVLGVQSEKPNQFLDGVSIGPLDDAARSRLNLDAGVNGVLITGVDENSEYSDRLASDMVIIEINRTRVTSPDDARRLIHPGRNLLLVYYNGRGSYVGLSVK